MDYLKKVPDIMREKYGKKENGVGVYIMFLFLPFLTTIYAIGKYKKNWSKNVFLLFVAYYGMTLVPSVGMDSYRMSEIIKYFNDYTVSFSDIIVINSDLRGGVMMYEYFSPIIIYLVTRVTGDYHIFYTIIGLIFGYFYVNNIYYAIKIKNNNPWTYFDVIVIMVFALVAPFWELMGIRFWLAGHIFLYGLIRLYFYEDKKGILFAIISCTVHYTYIYPFVLILGYSFIGVKFKYVFYFYILSLFLNKLNINLITDYIASLPIPHEFQEPINQYVNEDYASYIEFGKNEYNWYMKYYENALDLFIFFTLMLIKKKDQGFLIGCGGIEKIISFGLLMYSLTYYLSSVPSMGRFMVLGQAIIYFGIIAILNNKKLDINEKVKNTMLLPLLFFSIISIWKGFDSIGIMTIFGNPFLLLIADSELSMMNFIKSIIGHI